MAIDNLWQIRHGDTEYDLLPADLTVGRLRQMKQWFGSDYGKYLTFIQLVAQGDADACCCALWIVQTKAGEKPKEPRFMDFAISEFFFSDLTPTDDESEENPTPEASAVTVEPKPSSPQTPPISEPSISST